MDNTGILKDNLDVANVSLNDLYAKLREANVLDTKDVHAVILETSGDISVLHGAKELDKKILHGVTRTTKQF